jgi:hypothetical protein
MGMVIQKNKNTVDGSFYELKKLLVTSLLLSSPRRRGSKGYFKILAGSPPVR